jgi:hypothetical protein
VNNFAQNHPCKFFLNFKLGSSKDGTLNQIQDGAQFEILQISLFLNTTTTGVCL